VIITAVLFHCGISCKWLSEFTKKVCSFRGSEISGCPASEQPSSCDDKGDAGQTCMKAITILREILSDLMATDYDDSTHIKGVDKVDYVARDHTECEVITLC